MTVDPQRARSLFLELVENCTPDQWEAHLA